MPENPHPHDVLNKLEFIMVLLAELLGNLNPGLSLSADALGGLSFLCADLAAECQKGQLYKAA